MKTGFAVVNGIYIACPECEEAIEAEDGSQLIGVSEYDNLPRVLTCPSCGEKFRKPAFPAQRKRAA